MDNALPRPLCVDYSSPAWSGKQDAAPAAKRKTAGVAGAVRLSLEPPPRFRHLRKASVGLVFAAGGILVTTASNGTVEQAPRMVTASMSLTAPAFFFDDGTDALAAFAPDDASGGDRTNPPAADRLVDQAASALETLLPSDPDTPLVGVTSASAEQAALTAIRDRFEAPEGAITADVVVASGDTLSGILNRHGVKVEHMPKILAAQVVIDYLANLRIGQKLELTKRPDGGFHSLSAKVGRDRRVTIRRAESGFAVAAIDLPVEKERVVSSGTIEQSLYLAAEQADLKQSTIMALADIFQWELDFARDIRSGDRFSVVYDRLYREGRYIGDGDILAAEFVRGGKIYSAVRFTTDKGVTGYYSPDGRSKRRSFLRHPVDVVRITSKFDPNRLHPVLNTTRAHRGVDYGSPHGSPIYATADGTISYAGVKGAYGNMVKVRHGQNVDTLYAHMSKISDKTKVGRKVSQGDVIGYVGRTGRVTGTHLHYEFRKNGKHVDPLAVEFPAAAPLEERYRADLQLVSDSLVAQMRSVLPSADKVAAVVNPETAGD